MDTQDFNKITAKNVNILFLCIHNAGRSQMAAAIANLLEKESCVSTWEAQSLQKQLIHW